MKLTESEWQIMNVLWRRSPATAREVSEQLPKNVNWAYTTLKTLLTRLVAKEAVSERKRGNTSLYEPLVSQKKARRSAVGRLIINAFEGGIEPFLHFLMEERELTDKQRKTLLRILEEEEQMGEEQS